MRPTSLILSSPSHGAESRLTAVQHVERTNQEAVVRISLYSTRYP